MKPTLPLIILMLTLCMGCQRSQTSSTEDFDTLTSTEVERFDLASLHGELPDTMRPEVLQWLEVNRIARPEDYATSAAVLAFGPEVEQAFPMDTVLVPSGWADRLKSRTGIEPPVKVMAVISPFNESIILTGDTLVYLALNHYLGADHAAYDGFPNYIRRNKVATRIPIDLTEAMIRILRPMPTDEPPTLLQEMIYDGAVTQMVMAITGATEAEVLSLTPEQSQWIDRNESKAWRALIEKRMLYGTDPTTAARLLHPAPNASILNPEAPGRTAAALGSHIVGQWLKNHPDARPDTLLTPGFYLSASTLPDSRYAP